MSLLKRKGSASSSTITMVIAAIIALGSFVLISSQNKEVYVAKQDIPIGSKITSDMIGSAIVPISVPKSLANDFSITNPNEIVGRYVLNNLSDGKLVFSTDIATEKNLRENKTLKDLNLEAMTIMREKTTGITDSIALGDRLNVYSIISVDIAGPQDETSMPISSLNTEIQKMFLENGYNVEQLIPCGTYTFTKLIIQNVPVVEVERADAEMEGSTEIKTMSVGLNPDESEVLYLAMSMGQLGVNILPFSETEYEEKESKGGVSFAPFKTTDSVVPDLKK